VRAISTHRCPGAQIEGCQGATPARVTVRRGSHTKTVEIVPRYSREAGHMVLGFLFTAPPVRRFGALAAAGASVQEMWSMAKQTITGLGKALTSSKERKQLGSIVGISRVTEQAVAQGPGRGLVVLGYVSLVLAVLNLLPFLPLDGGHVLWAVAEKLRGRRVSLAAMWRFSSVGLALLVFLVISGFSNDIGRLGG
jgi:regulator of sigma E protease